ncbi:glycosyltransferase family 9 protein [Rhodospirillaceae bacterium KN72]|uniref:Glycosyltransferase family 9 protein n=1 Tax=Pacificispira spongiicola TaxID=2729598 RepID=A0A7Y0E092_9PROT|nr:glycosyltransferase family 9 protein [Pacificispira spongiicola]NMM44867.1 glycosyltransferase family 9 protein [Pacificispira spongiicola]
MTTAEEQDRLLVIKLGALGDFVQAMGPFQAIRKAHPTADITLLTTKPLAELAERSGWFDHVWIDERPRSLSGYWALRRRLLSGRFRMIFDLQTSDRSSNYWRMLWPHRPLLSGIAAGASHPHDNPDRDTMHTRDRQRDQLFRAGIPSVPPPDVSWMTADLSHLSLPDRFGLIVPGGAPHRPEKRWPADRFGALARHWVANGLTPVLIGTTADVDWTAAIAESCPQALNLTGRTSLFELAGLARQAEIAVGNDTGPMHLAAVTGCRCLVLYSHASDPALCAQKGPRVDILRVPVLSDLSVDTVTERLETGA